MTKTTNLTTPSDLLNYSRAGDTFHYRWAARRCLHLLKFNSNLDNITIEGSKEPKMGGECVIDTAEYSTVNDTKKHVEYFQLKHTTVQTNKDFKLSDLKGTIIGFAKRFKDIQKDCNNFASVKFTVITNRPICKVFKKSIKMIAQSEPVGKRFKKTLKSYTKLSDKNLKVFCSDLRLLDGAGDYDVQRHELHRELCRLTCESEDVQQQLRLVELVRARIEPKSLRKSINKEDVLEQFGFLSENDLFPAPPLFEKLTNVIERAQNDSFYKFIIDPEKAFNIFLAESGVGKSVTCNQLVKRFNTNGSCAVAYDCFGNGGYRKLTQHRHRPYDAFVQISNQLAQKGLCDVMLSKNNNQDDMLTKAFLSRLTQAIKKLREYDKDAILVIFFDAVDNAVMAAREFGHSSFVNTLLKEDLPEGCKVVYFSRPERLYLFDPPSKINQISLNLFNNEESLKHLRKNFPNATSDESIEFAQLTGNNPRIQANALALNKSTINDLLSYLGKGGVTVDDLIEEQLENAIINIKELYPEIYRNNIDDICTGLATLPPFVPIEVLAKASSTDISAVKSFVADLGRPLWITENFVQFRDEPTESWFTSTFSADKKQIKEYIKKLTPLASQFSYVAEVLPSLFLRSGQYKKLIDLALSEELLPNENPVDSRNIQVYRLQFAFKAALKNNRYEDACKLAMRAGEEVAGSERHMTILYKNFDLAAKFLSVQRIMEIAHHRKISGGWKGSENIYSALMLSFIPECEGESRSYLRIGKHWLQRFFEERDKAGQHYEDKLVDHDVFAMLYCCYNLNGEKAAIDFIKGWKSEQLIFRVFRKFASRMVDLSHFDVLERMADIGKSCPSLVIAINHELLKVGIILHKKTLTRTLNKILGPSKWLAKPSEYHSVSNQITKSAFLSLFESCIIRKLQTANIRRALNYYIKDPKAFEIDRTYYPESRKVLLRSIALRACIKNNFNLGLEDVTPLSWKKDKQSRDDHSEFNKAQNIISALLPWIMIRAELINGNIISLVDRHKDAYEKSNKIINGIYTQDDPLIFDITFTRTLNLLLHEGDVVELNRVIDDINSGVIKFKEEDKIKSLRIANRQSKLAPLSDILEDSSYEEMKIVGDQDTSEGYGNSFVSLSRAVIATSEADAIVYFEKSIEVVSRFGDEVVERWKATNSLACQSSKNTNHNSEKAYRFMRCAELVGNTVTREKHWSRSGAIKTGYKLCPVSLFAIVCRWKERGVGWSDRNYSALIEACIETNTIHPTLLWSLSTFPLESGIMDIAIHCLNNENKPELKQIILNDLISKYRQNGVIGDVWEYIYENAKSNGVEHVVFKDLEKLIGNKKIKVSQAVEETNIIQNSAETHLKKLYGSISFSSDEGLSQAYQVFKSDDKTNTFCKILKFATLKLNKSNVASFLLSLVRFENVDIYDLRRVFKYLPDILKNKPSVEKVWPQVIESIASRFPDAFIDYYRMEYLTEDFGDDQVTQNAILKGVLKGLSVSNDLNSASTYYGFVSYFASQLSVKEANVVLDFSLSRFEVHLDKDYADGLWRPTLKPPKSINKSISGFIWANLGSLKSSERWCSMHAVRRLYKLNCSDVIDDLIDWMLSKGALPFISHKYPFYDLHAKQYLLFALVRCVEDSPLLLLKHLNVFVKISLGDGPHTTIQKYASEIVLKIEKLMPKSISNKTKKSLQDIGVSQFPIEVPKDNFKYRDTPWHKNGEVYDVDKLYLSHDFFDSWLQPLGNVFNVPSKQVKDLVIDVILNTFKKKFNDKFIRDPRQELRDNLAERETINYKSDYPLRDSYSFYLTYHSMMIVAAKFFTGMPIIQPSYTDENQWREWLNSHLATNEGFWLSDRRDFFPVNRRLYDYSELNGEWRWNICSEDFLDCLLVDKDGETFLNVAGSWNEYSNGHNEEIRVTSRFVNSKLSKSLLNALISHESHVKGISCLEFFDSSEHKSSIINDYFKLKKWYKNGDNYNKIDEYDPYAGGVEYPLIKIDNEVCKLLDLNTDLENRNVTLASSGKKVIVNQVWSNDKPPKNNDDYYSKGNRIQISLNGLKNLCTKFGMDFIVQIDIQRQQTKNTESDNEFRYPPPYRKFYSFSKNGELRDRRKTIQIREKIN